MLQYNTEFRRPKWGKEQRDKGYDTEVKEDDHKFGYTDEEKFGYESHNSVGLKDSVGWKSTND